MDHSLVRFVITLILFQCVQGTLHHFNAKRPLRRSQNSDFIYRFEDESNIFLRKDDNGAVDKLSQLLRTRRQDAGGDPVAYQSDLIMDDSQYALTMYSGEGSKVIYLLTFNLGSSGFVSSSTLYRSTDYGQTFVNQYHKLPLGTVLDYNVYRFPNDTAVMFADATGSRIYVTTDEGEAFNYYNLPVDPRTMKMHPTMQGWILGHNPYHGVLMYSKYYGFSWDTVAENVHPLSYDYTHNNGYLLNDYNWGEPGIDWDTSNPSRSDVTKVYYSVIDSNRTSRNDRIVYVVYKDPKAGYVRKVFDPKLGYVSSFLIDGGYIYADRQISDDYYYGDYELHVSYMRKPFNLARVPTYFSHYSYFVGTHRGSQSLIIVDHKTRFNLYLSDETGTYYSLSLQDLVAQIYDSSTGYFVIDLEIISSINGTMMANQYVSVGGSLRNRTLITFDNGASWNGITAPVASSCAQPDCSLHFHMDSSRAYRRIGVYSRNSAPGIIVAHGNTGSYLTDTGTVYITRDGGLTWEQTLDYTWHVEIIDHGGLLVAAKDNHQDYSRTIKYSCNEGMSWTDFDFINSSIVVWGIVTEPGETTTQVLLLGTRSSEMRSDWIVIHVNFTAIFLRTCEASDYYPWTVSDGRIGDQQCLLGETRIIERRQPSVCCWNSRQYERLISATPCECTAADFECEYGYERDRSSGSCVLNRQYGPRLDCLTGYRKIPGNKCYDGVSSQFLPPDDCSIDAYFDESTGRNNDNNDNSSNDDNNSNTAVVVSVSVVVVIITLTTLILILLGVLIYFRKQNKRLTSTTPTADDTVVQNYQEPAVLAKISDQEILIGGTLDYDKLVEEKSEL